MPKPFIIYIRDGWKGSYNQISLKQLREKRKIPAGQNNWMDPDVQDAILSTSY